MARHQAPRRAAAVTAALLLLGGTAPAAAAVTPAGPFRNAEEPSPPAGVTPTEPADPHAGHGVETADPTPDPHAGHGVETADPTPDPHAGHGAAEHEEALTHEAEEAEEHGDHGQPGTATGNDDGEEHSDHGTGPETGTGTVSGSTRAIVLSGFGVVNTAVIGAAVLLRRRDRLTPSRAARQSRESRR